MEPRLKNSSKWTPLPEEFVKQIQEVAEDHFSDYETEGRTFVAEGRIYPNEFVLRLGLTAKKGNLRQDNFEASLEYDSEKEKALDKLHLLVDFLAETWTTFFEDAPADEDLPRQWTACVFEKTPLFMRYSSVNSELEKQADQFLNQFDKKLVYEEEEEEISLH